MGGVAAMATNVFSANQAGCSGREDGSSALLQWRAARNWILINALIYFLTSLLAWVADIRVFQILLSIPALYFVGGVMAFVKLMLLGNPLNPIAWYQLGSSVFFGAGLTIAALNPNSAIYSVQEQVIDDLLRANLLNSSSVLVVLVVATALHEDVQRGYYYAVRGEDRLRQALVRVFNPILYVLPFVIGVKYYTFPIAENLVLRGIVGYLAYLEMLFYFALAYLWPQLRISQKQLGLVFFALFAFLSIAAFSKLAAIMPFLIICVGYWLRKTTPRSIVLSGFGLILLYAAIQPAFTVARMTDYNAPEYSTVYARLTTLRDAVIMISTSNVLDELSSEENTTSFASATSRFSTLEIQGFLIREYEDNRPGYSLNDFWVALIPRALWPDKPNITRFGAELDGIFWGRGGESSALAPSYNGEAYWNYGPLGVFIVSLVLGLELAWLARHAHLARLGRDTAYYMICLPAILLAVYMETWVAASYVGGFITLVLIYYIAKRFLPLGEDR